MAQVTKRGSKWQARIQWRDSNKNYRRTKSKSGFNTKAAAREWAIEEAAKLNKGVMLFSTKSIFVIFIILSHFSPHGL
ncbi:DUF3622 domain-containing protein [Limosilactobacillus equigenerosi]|uniref:DUF3622 domain-containing protein n=1 Tax=Limosilactobacillus equigenerosi TaxID=417373 RepID=UPI0006D28CC3|nr:DUF3622 domain-containing protein [Limosilactobacillus equigenerosi]